MIGISENRTKHILAVAREMQRRAEEAGWPQEKCREMFILGYVHDIGYEFAENQPDHAAIGGLLLKEQNYPYWQEVYWHGKINAGYASDALQLLNTVDMCIDSAGNPVDIHARLADIMSRYGENSVQYKEARIFSVQIGLLEE